MRKEELPGISVIVIGMNEEENLEATFSAINNIDYEKEKVELIYVDTGSSDNSVEIARRYTKKVFIEKSNWPTPGLARNKGLIEASHDIIHFVDGDIQIYKNYLKIAVEKLKEPNLHAVYGYLEEKSNKGINRILLSHWHQKKPGISDATGGGGTYKKETLLKVNGYDERIKRGQETELGERFRKAGYTIWLLNTLMGTHNYGVKTIADYCKFQITDGKSKSYNMLLGKVNNFFVESRRASLRNIFFNLSLLIFLVIVFLSREFMLLAAGLLTSIFIYPLIKYYFIKRIHSKDKIIYFFLMNISRIFIFWGQMEIFLKYLYCKIFKREKFLKDKMILSDI